MSNNCRERTAKNICHRKVETPEPPGAGRKTSASASRPPKSILKNSTPSKSRKKKKSIIFASHDKDKPKAAKPDEKKVKAKTSFFRHFNFLTEAKGEWKI